MTNEDYIRLAKGLVPAVRSVAHHARYLSRRNDDPIWVDVESAAYNFVDLLKYTLDESVSKGLIRSDNHG